MTITIINPDGSKQTYKQPKQYNKSIVFLSNHKKFVRVEINKNFDNKFKERLIKKQEKIKRKFWLDVIDYATRELRLKKSKKKKIVIKIPKQKGAKIMIQKELI